MPEDNLSVRRAVAADARLIREIALAAYIDAWSELDYLAEIERNDSFVFIAESDGIVAGFLLARTVPGNSEKPDADLYNIAVRPEMLRQGVGAALMSELLRAAASTHTQNIWLEVRESNSAAIRFYERHGFVKELTRPNFYNNPVENALIMRRKLGHSSHVNSV